MAKSDFTTFPLIGFDKYAYFHDSKTCKIPHIIYKVQNVQTLTS